MPFDVARTFAERTGENFALHERYMNHQLARTLRTLGFDRNYVRGEGCYLYDDAGARYLDFLVRVRRLRTRPEPSGSQGRAAPGARPRPAQHGPDGLRPAARPAGRAASRPHARGHQPRLLLQLRRRVDRGRDQVRTALDAAAEDPLRRARLPRSDHGRAGAERRQGVPQGLRRPAGVGSSPVRQSRGARAAAARQGRGGLHRRADPGQGRLLRDA